MGRSVRLSSDTVPPAYRDELCPHCGSLIRVHNGQLLRFWRERAGIDQRTLAKQLGISGPYLSDIERNRRTFPASIVSAYKHLVRRKAR